jgi:phosphoglycerate kinase
MISFRTLADLPADLTGQKVLARFDWNVPVENGKVANDYRLRASFETLGALINKGAAVIALSHLGREGDSLAPVVAALKEHFPAAFLVEDPFSAEGASALGALSAGQFAVVENVRRWPGEEANDAEFAAKLAALGTLYVNDAFPVSHRAHASVDALPRLLPSYAGAQFSKEVAALGKAFTPESPFVFILGGAKFETKIPLLRRFQIADSIFLGGALLNDILRAKGMPVGGSLVSKDTAAAAAAAAWPNLVLPEAIVVANAAGVQRTIAPGEPVGDDERILDVCTGNLKAALAGAKFVLWNGPLGLCEEGFRAGTEAAAALVADSGAESIVGGGDTVAAIESLELSHRFTFVSTAGGAMLEFLASGGNLPGIAALASSAK